MGTRRHPTFAARLRIRRAANLDVVFFAFAPREIVCTNLSLTHENNIDISSQPVPSSAQDLLTPGHSVILNGTWNNILLRVPTFWQQQPQHDEWVRRFSEFHVQSHNFRDLEANSRFEAIVQTKNQFGWSEPTKSFVFHTRLAGESGRIRWGKSGLRVEASGE